MPGADLHPRLPFTHLSDGHQPAMIVLMTSKRGPPPLDRVGEKTDRALVIDGHKLFGHRLDAIASKILHQNGQFGIRSPGEQR